MKKKQQKINKKNVTRTLCFLISLCILLGIYKSHKNKQDKAKIFSDNSITISDSEVEIICDQLEGWLNVDISEEDKDEYLVLNSIKENDEFGEYKLWFCENLINLIKDNSYLNKEEVYKSLLNVDIAYKTNVYSVNNGIQGRHDSFRNKIEVYSGYPSLDVTFHEVLHCFFNNVNTQKLPRFFKEGMTELLTNEYSNIGNYPYQVEEVYPFEVTAVKMLCELTSPDIVLKAFTLGNMNYIIDEMAKITGNKEEVKEAIKVMGEATDYLKSEKSYDSQEFNKKCISVFQKCIDSKYTYDDPNYLSYYYNETLFYNCLFTEGAIMNYKKDIELYGFDGKVYFSNTLKEKIESGEFDEIKKKNEKQKVLDIFNK